MDGPSAPLLQCVPLVSPGEKLVEEDEGEEGYGSRWDQLQAPQVLCRPTVQECGIYIQHEPEGGKSATAVENLRGISTWHRSGRHHHLPPGQITVSPGEAWKLCKDHVL